MIDTDNIENCVTLYIDTDNIVYSISSCVTLTNNYSHC